MINAHKKMKSFTSPHPKKKEKEKEKEKINDLFLLLLSASLWSYLADYLFVNLDKMS